MLIIGEFEAADDGAALDTVRHVRVREFVRLASDAKPPPKPQERIS